MKKGKENGRREGIVKKEEENLKTPGLKACTLLLPRCPFNAIFYLLVLEADNFSLRINSMIFLKVIFIGMNNFVKFRTQACI